MTDTPPNLKAGPLTAFYQNGFLRYIRYGNEEVLRMMYFALRDQDWNTLVPVISEEVIEKQENRFVIHYQCHHFHEGKAVLHWQAALYGNPDGSIVFDLKGTVLENFWKNRAGFCVLHPIVGVCGQPCRIIHPDGTSTEDRFPVFIAPHTPFQNVREMHWKHNGQHPFSLRLEGEVFETEDHRNWTDTSFKTYCTPLELPRPVELQKGETLVQKIIFKPETPLPARTFVVPLPETDSLPFIASGLKIGICASAENRELSAKAAVLLRELPLSHYRIEVRQDAENWVSDFSQECKNAALLKLPLEIALHLPDNPEALLMAFTYLCEQNRLNVSQLLLLSQQSRITSHELLSQVLVLRQHFPHTKIGAGTDNNFADFNRSRFDASLLDFVSYAIHPQQHATDDLTLLENTDSQADTVMTARHIYGNHLPIHISPLTLQPRFFPLTNPDHRKGDPRQQTAFLAVWLEASLKSLATAGAASVTLLQTTGSQGILSGEGEPYPVYEVLKNLKF